MLRSVPSRLTLDASRSLSFRIPNSAFRNSECLDTKETAGSPISDKLFLHLRPPLRYLLTKSGRPECL
jgi:hypothetical protein